MSEFKPWKVVDSYYPSFKEVVGASFKISVVMFATDISFEQSVERSRDLDLIAEAGTVRAETGLTPSQLQARVAELEAALADEREKSAFWAEKAHEMRGQALRGEPVDGIIQP